MKNVCLLGATGSIGLSALDVLRHHPTHFRLYALTANSSVDLAVAAVREFQPSYVVMRDSKAAEETARQCAWLPTKVLCGEDDIVAVAQDDKSDIVISAIVGAAALRPTIAALRAGKRVALANKEALVMAGELAIEAANRSGAEILPVDSEHSAVFQCMGGRDRRAVKTITLTASGGPFRTTPNDKFASITVADALHHPTWSMGAKITIDSATMFNKALEVIEAHFLFNAPYEGIRVVVHPQSIVHSLVEFDDGSSLAQMSMPDMRLPIQIALTWPNRLEGTTPVLDLAKVGKLEFFEVDAKRFPSVEMGYEAGRRGGTAPTALNAANEAAVARFMAGQIGFAQIFELVSKVLEKEPRLSATNLDDILAVDRWAREEVYKA